MVTIRPVDQAMIPVDSDAAQKIMGPNYDEFQSDLEVFEIIQAHPENILRLTMAHCDVETEDEILKDGSPEALDKARANRDALRDSDLTRISEGMLWIYEIKDRRFPDRRQIGLGGYAASDEIRTEETPDGVVIRNEGIRDEKARGRAVLIEKTEALIGTVNLAVEDPDGSVAKSLEAYADSHDVSYEATDEFDNLHRVWVIDQPQVVERFQELMADVPYAYVADGNHRSAAAAMLGKPNYLAVFFTCERMGLAPYNRLVKSASGGDTNWAEALSEKFEVTPLESDTYQPSIPHEIGLYANGQWLKLIPRPGSFDPENAVEDIDSNIVQRHIFEALLGIADARDPQLTFVGGNKDAAYLKAQVDSGDYALAITLPPVTMLQFVNVCRQNRFMPPKSTWFEPKIRSGLVSALL